MTDLNAGMQASPTTDALGEDRQEEFEQLRPLLFSIAYRLLGRFPCS